MRAVILTGGKGERLKPLTNDTRKAFLPLGNKRVIDHIIDRLPKGLKFEISEDDSGAIPAVNHAIKGRQPLMVICGDNYFSENLDGFISAYGGYTLVGIHDALILERARHLGVIELHLDGRQISRITEKPAHPATTLVSTGLYIFPPEVFCHIRNLAMTQPTANLGELIGHLLFFDPVYSYFFKGTWIDIGTRESYEQAVKFEATLFDTLDYGLKHIRDLTMQSKDLSDKEIPDSLWLAFFNKAYKGIEPQLTKEDEKLFKLMEIAFEEMTWAKDLGKRIA